MTRIALLPDRGVVRVDGPDRVAFLQGLVSNDVALAAPGATVWAALLTPQGKWLADFFIFSDGESLLLDCERIQAAAVAQRLSRYRLRAQASVADESAAWHVHAAWNGAPAIAPPALGAPDPRLPEAGWRVLSPNFLPVTDDPAAYDRHRLLLGLPDGSRDLEPEKSVLLEAGFDELHGVSWSKGCYMGQELTARTKYRGLVKRRLLPVAVEGSLPGPGTPVLQGATEVGVMRSGVGDRGLAQLRLDADWTALACGEAQLRPEPAAWMVLGPRTS